MTPQEQERLTKLAMENAKKPVKTERQKQPLQPVMANQPVETPKNQPTKPKKEQLKSNQRQLGQRVVTLQPWNGKTKKKFKKEFELVTTPEDVDLLGIIDILVSNQIKEDYLLTDLEMQYLLGELKKISLGDDFENKSTCPNCGEMNKFKTSVTKNAIYTPDTLPAKYEEWEFVNVTKTAFQKVKDEIMESDDYDGLTTSKDIEMLVKIKKDKLTPQEIMKLLDDTPIKKIENLIDAFESHLAKYTLKETRKCKKCQKEVDFDLDVVTGIFEVLAK